MLRSVCLVLGAQLWRAVQGGPRTLHHISRFRTQQPGTRDRHSSSCVSRPVAEIRRKCVANTVKLLWRIQSPEPQSPHPTSARSGTGHRRQPAAYRPELGRGTRGTTGLESPISRRAKPCSLGNPHYPRRPRQIPSPGMVLSSSALALPMPLGTPGAWAFQTGATSVDSGGTSDRAHRSAHGTHSDPELLEP